MRGCERQRVSLAVILGAGLSLPRALFSIGPLDREEGGTHERKKRVLDRRDRVDGLRCAGAVQEKLGDLIASGGYEWIIGKWVATTDEGQKVECNFDWAVDKCAVLNGLRMGDFTYQGIVTLSPTAQEAVDVGADGRGGIWKGTWSPAGEGLVRKVEHTSRRRSGAQGRDLL